MFMCLNVSRENSGKKERKRKLDCQGNGVGGEGNTIYYYLISYSRCFIFLKEV